MYFPSDQINNNVNLQGREFVQEKERRKRKYDAVDEVVESHLCYSVDFWLEISTMVEV